MTSGEARLIASLLLNLVMFGMSLIAALGTAFLAGPTVAGEVESGQALAMLARPVRRSSVLLGKWLGLVAFGCAYVLGGRVRPDRSSSALTVGYWPPSPAVGLALLAAETVVLLTLALLLSSVISTMASGIVAVGLFGATWVAGVVGGIGGALGNEGVERVGTVSRMILPTDGLWRGAMNAFQDPGALAADGRRANRLPVPERRAADAPPTWCGRRSGWPSSGASPRCRSSAATSEAILTVQVPDHVPERVGGHRTVRVSAAATSVGGDERALRVRAAPRGGPRRARRRPRRREAETLLHARGWARRPLDRLLAAAGRVRDAGLASAGRPGVVTYSRKVFIPLTRLCRDRCHYCTFATTPGRAARRRSSSPDEVLEIARAGRGAGLQGGAVHPRRPARGPLAGGRASGSTRTATTTRWPTSARWRSGCWRRPGCCRTSTPA